MLLITGIILLPTISVAQDEINDDLGNVSDEFQEYFFEALKQKAIENYEKAIEQLLKCKKIDANNSVVDFEIGKNYLLLKDYGAAETNILRALEKDPDNEWYLEALYEVYFRTQDYPKAIGVAKKLVNFHPIYREDLLTLYMRTSKYKEALDILDDLDTTDGQSDKRDSIRAQLFTLRDFGNEEVDYLRKRISANPKNEKHYLALIYLLSEQGDIDKAFQVAKDLQAAIPKSKLAHLGLFKYYLRDNEVEKAIGSMNIVLKSPEIDTNAKFKVLNEFLGYTTNHPELETSLEEAVKLFAKMEGTNKVFKELGNYYLNKNQKGKASKYLSMVANEDVNDFDSLKKTLFLLAEIKDYEELYKRSNAALENYPAQSVLYLLNGAALNNLNRHKEAVLILESGIDYLIDDIKIESAIYKELIIAFRALNNAKKVKDYEQKLIKISQ